MKLSRRFTGAAALALPLILTLSACTSGNSTPADETTNIVVLTPYLSSAATKEAIDEFTISGEKLGWSISVVDTAGDMNKLNSAFQDAAAQQPDAIVLGTGDPTQISLGLKSASAAGIPVFAMDAGQDDLIAANVTSDNTDLGEQSANALIELMGGSGAVVMLTHEPHPGVKARAVGARDTFTAAGITVLEEKHVDNPGAVDSARTSMQDIISSRGAAVNGVWGGWDEPALGATQALNAATVSNVPVVGVDGQDFALAEIDKEGPFKATIKQDWTAVAGKVVALIQDLIDNGTAPAESQYELPGTLVTGTK